MESERKPYQRHAGHKICLSAMSTVKAALVVFLFLFLIVSAPKTSQAAGTFEFAPEKALQAAQDIEISKTHSGDFRIGSTGVYTIGVSNVGINILGGPITVTDVLTVPLSAVNVIGNGWNPCGFSGRSLTCVYENAAGLPAGGSLPPIRMSVSVGEFSSTLITNTASVSNTNDTILANNVAADPTQLVGADLAVTKSVSPTIPSEGNVITYTVRVVNNGPSNTTGVQLTDALPASLTFIGSDASQGTYTSGTGVWQVGNMANGANATLEITARVNSNTRGTTILNSVSGLTSSINDYKASNNTASVSIVVGSTRVAGLVTDRGTSNPLSGASVVLTDAANHVYTLSTAVNGWYTFTSTITNPIVAGAGQIRVSKTGYATSTTSRTVVDGVVNRYDVALDTSDLLVTKTDGLSTVLPGQTITYTLVISNVGSIQASNVIITDVLPVYLTYITDTLNITHSIPLARQYVWKLKNPIGPNQGVRFKLRTRVADTLPSPSTAITNLLNAKTSSPEANTTNNQAQDTNTSSGTHNGTVTITVSPSQVRTNQSVTYSIKVSNTGTAPVTNVEMTDTFSAFLDITSATTTKGTATRNSAARSVTVTISALNANETVTITVVGRVISTVTANTTVTNSASLKYVFGNTTYTRASNTVSFQILASSTLPGTGGIELDAPVENPSAKLALISCFLVGLLGLGLLGYAYRARVHNPEWASWALKMGIVFALAALFFGAATQAIINLSAQRARTDTLLQATKPAIAWRGEPTATQTEEPIYWGIESTEVVEKLPDFPIPTPTIIDSVDPNEPEPDASPTNRIVIPILNLDTVVKYVPYDGLTWMIAGLQNEVAWMGETSWPGLGGNTGLAGHVTLRGGQDGPFRNLSDLVQGDFVLVYTDENLYTYQVRAQQVVGETDMSVIQPTGSSQLTLITCTDWNAYTGFYQQRLVVYADLIQTKPLAAKAQGN